MRSNNCSLNLFILIFLVCKMCLGFSMDFLILFWLQTFSSFIFLLVVGINSLILVGFFSSSLMKSQECRFLVPPAVAHQRVASVEILAALLMSICSRYRMHGFVNVSHPSSILRMNSVSIKVTLGFSSILLLLR